MCIKTYVSMLRLMMHLVLRLLLLLLIVAAVAAATAAATTVRNSALRQMLRHIVHVRERLIAFGTLVQLATERLRYRVHFYLPQDLLNFLQSALRTTTTPWSKVWLLLLMQLLCNMWRTTVQYAIADDLFKVRLQIEGAVQHLVSVYLLQMPDEMAQLKVGGVAEDAAKVVERVRLALGHQLLVQLLHKVADLAECVHTDSVGGIAVGVVVVVIIVLVLLRPCVHRYGRDCVAAFTGCWLGVASRVLNHHTIHSVFREAVNP